MISSFVISLGFLMISALWSLIAEDWLFTVKLSGSIGVICLLLSAIFVGALSDGDRLRAFDAFETKEDRRSRRKWAINCAIVGLPNLLAAILIIAIKFSK